MRNTSVKTLIKRGYSITIGCDEQLSRMVAFEGAGLYSMDKQKVYRRGRFTSFSRLFIGDKRL